MHDVVSMLQALPVIKLVVVVGEGGPDINLRVS